MRKVMIAALAAPVLMAGTLTDQQAAEAFGAREDMETMTISPDGQQVMFLQPAGPRGSAAMVVPLADLRPRVALVATGEPERLTWCDFVGNRRIVCRARAMGDLTGVLLPISRLLAANTDGTDIKLLGQRDSADDARIRQYDGDILDLVPGDEQTVLMARDYVPEAGRAGTRLLRTKDGLGVDAIDTVTLKSRKVEAPLKTATDFMTDGRGEVRIAEFATTQVGDQLGSRVNYRFNRRGSSGWSELGSYDVETGEGLRPLAVEAQTDSALVLKKLNGRQALYRMALDGTGAESLVYANDEVDVDGIIRSGNGRSVIGVTFADDTRQSVYFDPEARALVQKLSGALPKLPLIDIVDADESGSRLIVHASSDQDPGRYYLYDGTKGALQELGLVRPQLEKTAMSAVTPVRYPAADGVAIPGYLTLPPGATSANGLPGVVLPHGGPSARDEWGFDWLPQFLANRGYAVLQPNYRGSAGYGDQWFEKNGFQGWETAIGDITAGARWLTTQGVPADKLAIVGWSYGGYAALQSAAVSPDTYKAVVAIAPVADLAMLKQQAREYTNAALVESFVGNGSHVRAGSPLQNVDRITAPVLLVHGTRDINVDVSQSRAMHAALDRAGKVNSYIEYDGLEHDLDDSAARAKMLGAIVKLLDSRLK